MAIKIPLYTDYCTLVSQSFWPIKNANLLQKNNVMPRQGIKTLKASIFWSKRETSVVYIRTCLTPHFSVRLQLFTQSLLVLLECVLATGLIISCSQLVEGKFSTGREINEWSFVDCSGYGQAEINLNNLNAIHHISPKSSIPCSTKFSHSISFPFHSLIKFILSGIWN